MLALATWQAMAEAMDAQIEKDMVVMQQVIEKGRGVRDRHNLSMRTPLPEVTLVHKDRAALEAVKRLEGYIREELNVRTVKTALVSEVPELVRFKCLPNHKLLGARFGKAYKSVQGEITKLTHEQLAAFMASGSVTIGENAFTAEDILVSLEYSGDTKVRDCEPCDGGLVLLDTKPDASMLDEAMAREVCAKVQKMRKEAGLRKGDEVEVGFACSADDSTLAKVLTSQAEYVTGRIGRPLLPLSQLPSLAVPLGIKTEDVRVQRLVDGAIAVANETLTLSLCRGCAFFDEAKLAKLLPDATVRDGAKAYVHYKDFGALKAELAAAKGALAFTLDGVKVQLQLGQHLFLGSSDAAKAGAL